MRRYETVFIIRPNAGEEEINRVIDYVTEIITQEQGSIIELNRWGLKKLSYLIKKESMGYYVFCDYASNPAGISEIERRFRIDDAVIKFMTLKTADFIDTAAVEQAVSSVNERVASEEAAQKEAEEAAKADKEEKSAEKTTDDKKTEDA